MPPIPASMSDLSTTAASNSPAGTDSPTSGDDYLRSIQAIIRSTNAKGADIASASTTDIGAATGEFVDVTGTTTITGLGTIAAGIVRTVRFTGALTLTHNATSLQLPGGANITTANGDVAQFRSLGSGNWKCVNYMKADGTPIIQYRIPDGDKGDITVSSSGATWTIDNDAVTFAKMQNIATSKLLGRATTGSGDVEELGIGSGLSLSGTDLTALCIGVGQTWQDVTASRALNTTYTNSTGKPITVVIASNNSSVAATVTVNGVALPPFGSFGTTGGYGHITFIVPNLGTYSITYGATLNKWAELR